MVGSMTNNHTLGDALETQPGASPGGRSSLPLRLWAPRAIPGGVPGDKWPVFVQGLGSFSQGRTQRGPLSTALQATNRAVQTLGEQALHTCGAWERAWALCQDVRQKSRWEPQPSQALWGFWRRDGEGGTGEAGESRSFLWGRDPWTPSALGAGRPGNAVCAQAAPRTEGMGGGAGMHLWGWDGDCSHRPVLSLPPCGATGPSPANCAGPSPASAGSRHHIFH